jgi:hypothetical protein
MLLKKKIKNPKKKRKLLKTEKNRKGETLTYLEDAKYPMRGKINSSFMQKVLNPLKKVIKNWVIEQAKHFEYDKPDEELTEPVREVARCFDELIEAEQGKGMKNKWRSMKKIMCAILEEDDAYRYRFQWFVEKFNKKKLRLSKEDKYFFRGKRFEVDN